MGTDVKRSRLPVSQRNRSRLVEKQDVNVSRCLDGAARHCDDVSLNHSVHSRNPDGREQSSDGCGNQRTALVHRSEEHTSELQSPDHLVCRLLLEKKKIQAPVAAMHYDCSHISSLYILTDSS